MSSITLATKYASQVDEVFKLGALTTGITNGNRYDFVGAKTVKVYGMGTAPMNDYEASGSNRYGDPIELEDTTEELTLSQQRSFSFTIDATNRIDSPEGVRDAGIALRRQLDKVVIPELDTYRLKVAATRAKYTVIGAVTTSNAYSMFTDATAKLNDSEVPDEGRIAYCSNTFVNAIKKCPEYIQASDIAQNMLIKGQIGEVDGVAIMRAPKGRMPAGAAFVIIHSEVLTSPVKLAEYRIHENPPGIAGHLVEGLVYYDAFATENKRFGIAVQFSALGEITLSMTTKKVNVSGSGKLVIGRNAAGTLKYQTGTSITLPKFNEAVGAEWLDVPANGVIAATEGDKVAVVSAVNGKAVAASAVIDVVVTD